MTGQTIGVKRAARLALKKHRESERLFLAEGASVVAEAPVQPLALFETPEKIEKVSSLKTPTGPVGVFPFVDVGVREVLSRAGIVVALHGVQDPGNVGTIVRSAHAFGAGVVLTEGCADLYNPKTVRATMGSIFRAPVARGVEVSTLLELAHEVGFETIASVASGGEAPGWPSGEKRLFVVGAEGRGLPDAVVRACQRRVTIPCLAPSLNAAVAAAILMHGAFQRPQGRVLP